MEATEERDTFFEELGEILVTCFDDRYGNSEDLEPSIDKTSMDFARYLRAARCSIGLSHKELADKAGLPEAKVIALEHGLIDPTRVEQRWLNALAEALNEDVEDLALVLEWNKPKSRSILQPVHRWLSRVFARLRGGTVDRLDNSYQGLIARQGPSIVVSAKGTGKFFHSPSDRRRVVSSRAGHVSSLATELSVRMRVSFGLWRFRSALVGASLLIICVALLLIGTAISTPYARIVQASATMEVSVALSTMSINTPTLMPTDAPTATATFTPRESLTPTPTDTPTPTNTSTFTSTPSYTASNTPTLMPTETPTPIPSPTPTATHTSTPAPPPAPTDTPTPTPHVVWELPISAFIVRPGYPDEFYLDTRLLLGECFDAYGYKLVMTFAGGDGRDVQLFFKNQAFKDRRPFPDVLVSGQPIAFDPVDDPLQVDEFPESDLACINAVGARIFGGVEGVEIVSAYLILP